MYNLRGKLAQHTSPLAVSACGRPRLPVVSCAPPPAQHVKGTGLGVNQVVLAQRQLVAACDSNIVQIWRQQQQIEEGR